MLAAIFVFLFAVAAEVSSFSIADKLHSPFSSDCFKRISIGQRLISYDVSRIVSKSTVKGCEEECNILECTFFSFGISADGNGTCELSTVREISKRQSTDYDLYERTKECSEGKPTGYEEVCYRRLVSGRRLDERFIRHALPCDTLEACQHQCSVEKHFKCEGFNIRQKSGGGICELSSVATAYLAPGRDFRYDPEFDYYERDHSNASPNCGAVHIYNAINLDNADQRRRVSPSSPPAVGGPYQGGDSYGHWSTGYGGPEHGPWGSHGYGSGSYISNNPVKGSTPTYPLAPTPSLYYGPGNRGPPYDYHPNEIPDRRNYGDKGRPYDPRLSYPDSGRYPSYPPQGPHRVPTYIIIESGRDGDRFGGGGGTYGSTYPRPPTYPQMPPYLPPPPSSHPPPSSYPQLPYHPQRPSYPPQLPANPRPQSYPRPPAYGPPRDLAPRRDDFRGPSGSAGREVCFQRAHVGYRLDPKFVRDFHVSPSVLDCEERCTKSSYKCTGYSFRYSDVNGGEPNCALTDYSSGSPKQSLLPDRGCDFYHRMSACSSSARTPDAECFLKTYSNQRILPDKIRRAVFVRAVSDCELECLKSYRFTCRSFTFRYGPGVIGEPAENCFLSDWPVRDLHPTADYGHSPGCEVYERGSYGHGCELDAGPPSIGPGYSGIGYPQINDKYQWNRQEMWRHFTVRGWPCRAGTQCQLNREAGFWSCEVEGGDRAQWDYCCRPGHSCGFSRGHYYPWCYVGEAGPDQWRPCSEQFYPDFGNRHTHRPGQASKPHPSNAYDPNKGNGPWSYGQEDFGPPSYWPILYLYTEPPPNATEPWAFDDPPYVPYQLQGLHDDAPKIQFRPSKHKLSHPKGIVLKIDLKDKVPASDPGYQAHKDEGHPLHVHPRYNYRNHVETFEKVPVRDLGYPPYWHRDCHKANLQLESDPPTSPSPDYKRDILATDKSKEVIRDVEKIIEETTKEAPKKNETSGEEPPK